MRTSTERAVGGSAYVLGDNVDTDQIVRAEHCTHNPSSPEGYQELGRHAMSGLPDGFPPFIDPGTGKAVHRLIVAGRNFGCGSSREHAPIALGAAGVTAVLAESFARIFFRNCIASGELLPVQVDGKLGDLVATGDQIAVDLERGEIRRNGERLDVRVLPLGDIARIVEAGGIFAYARAVGKIPARAAPNGG
jgi:3-isopropylmalate/(R)-2-methylmalate dehydratase small subunit